MAVTPLVRIQSEDFSAEAEIRKITSGRTDIGAVVTFSGLCRSEGEKLSALELEHYPGMAEDEITKIANQAIERFELTGLTAIHRYGKIAPGENIVLVIAASKHRQAAFDGCAFIMDFLKTEAPFWKKEYFLSGDSGWVSARDDDQEALHKWHTTNQRDFKTGSHD